MIADRGQLLLVGAILFSVVVVGIVVQLNGLQYTDTAASGGQTDAIDRASQTEAETRDALARLVTKVRADTDRDEFADALRENVSTYRNTSQNMTAAGGAIYTNVTVNETASVNESVVSQSGGDYQAQNPPNPSDWTLVTDVTNVTRFWLNESTVTGGGTPFAVVVSNPSGQQWELRLQRVTGGPGPDDVDVVVATPASTTTACTRPDSTDIELNLVDGSGAGAASGCSFTSFTDAFDGPYTIEFEKGNKAEGGYEIATLGGSVRTSNFDPSNVEDQIFAPAIDYQYRSPSTAYNRTFVVGGAGS